MEKLTKKTFQRWVEWTKKIKYDLQDIVNDQQIYDYFIKIANENIDHISNNQGVLFCNFVRNCYINYAAVAVRRHNKTKDDSISLRKLLDQLLKSSKHFTYDFYIEQYPIEPNNQNWQKRTFVNFSDDEKILSQQKIKNDLNEMDRIAGKVSDFVDKSLAHLDKKGFDEKIYYGMVTASIELFNKLACKYICLILGEGYVTLSASILGDWKKIFTVPLDTKKYD